MRLQDLYAAYGERVQFLMIYIREAHPEDGWRLPLPGQPRFADPQTIEERRLRAGECQSAVMQGVTTLVDGMDDAVMRAYAAWPDRLYLIDEEGRVAYAGGPGPFGFRPAQLKAAIDRLLGGR